MQLPYSLLKHVRRANAAGPFAKIVALVMRHRYTCEFTVNKPQLDTGAVGGGGEEMREGKLLNYPVWRFRFSRHAEVNCR